MKTLELSPAGGSNPKMAPARLDTPAQAPWPSIIAPGTVPRGQSCSASGRWTGHTVIPTPGTLEFACAEATCGSRCVSSGSGLRGHEYLTQQHLYYNQGLCTIEQKMKTYFRPKSVTIISSHAKYTQNIFFSALKSFSLFKILHSEICFDAALQQTNLPVLKAFKMTSFLLQIPHCIHPYFREVVKVLYKCEQ